MKKNISHLFWRIKQNWSKSNLYHLFAFFTRLLYSTKFFYARRKIRIDWKVKERKLKQSQIKINAAMSTRYGSRYANMHNQLNLFNGAQHNEWKSHSTPHHTKKNEKWKTKKNQLQLNVLHWKNTFHLGMGTHRSVFYYYYLFLCFRLSWCNTRISHFIDFSSGQKKTKKKKTILHSTGIRALICSCENLKYDWLLFFELMQW